MISFAELYRALLAVHGPQRWWPADDDPFEIMVGALLVQRTTWSSAVAAIGRLRERALLDPERLGRADPEVVERCVRSAGFFRTKAGRLRNLARFVVERGGMAGLGVRPTPELRALLLGLEGVGPETADAILLYAFDRPAVVVDAYLRRLTGRLTADEAPADSELRSLVAGEIGDAARLNEFHALVVAHGKQACRREPLCGRCAIRQLCRTGRESRADSLVSDA